MDANGLAGEGAEIERPPENVHSRRAAVLITERRERCEQRPRRTSYFNEETIENRCSRRFARRDVQPELQIRTPTRNSYRLEQGPGCTIHSVNDRVGSSAVRERSGAARHLSAERPRRRTRFEPGVDDRVGTRPSGAGLRNAVRQTSNRQ